MKYIWFCNQHLLQLILANISNLYVNVESEVESNAIWFPLVWPLIKIQLLSFKKSAGLTCINPVGSRVIWWPDSFHFGAMWGLFSNDRVRFAFGKGGSNFILAILTSFHSKVKLTLIELCHDLFNEHVNSGPWTPPYISNQQLATTYKTSQNNQATLGNTFI